jgi:hypothetical protein
VISPAINKFISELSPLGKKLLIVTIFIVMITLFDRLLIAPTMTRLNAIDEETMREEAAIKKDLKFLSYKDRISKEAQIVDPFIVEDVPTEDELNAAFLKKIEITANKANVILAKVTPSPSSLEKDNLSFSADLESSGKLTDIITFMHMINASDELTKVIKFNLGSKKSDSDDIKATMTIKKLVVSRNPISKSSNADSNSSETDAPKN